MTRNRYSLVHVILWLLIFSGCTHLSMAREQALDHGTALGWLWAVELVIGVAGVVYLAVTRRVEPPRRYGIPVFVFGLVVSYLVPSTYTRLLVLLVFLALTVPLLLKARSDETGRTTS